MSKNLKKGIHIKWNASFKIKNGKKVNMKTKNNRIQLEIS